MLKYLSGINKKKVNMFNPLKLQKKAASSFFKLNKDAAKKFYQLQPPAVKKLINKQIEQKKNLIRLAYNMQPNQMKLKVNQLKSLPIYPSIADEIEMSGLGKNFFQKAKQKVQQAAQKAKATIKKAGQEIKKGAQKVVKVVAKVGLAPSRGSFMLLVRLNVFGLAKGLAKQWNKDSGKIKAFWKDLGGDENELKKVIATGSKMKVNGIGAIRSYYRKNGYIGVEPVTTATAAAVASATPIIVKVVDLLKKSGINIDTVKKGIDAGKKLLAKADNVSKAAIVVPAENADKTQVTVDQNPLPGQTAETTTPTPTTTPTTKTETTINKGLLIGGAIAAAGAIYLISKRKK